MSIIAGSNGPILELTLTEKGKVINLQNSSVSVVIEKDRHRVEKITSITNATNGVCEFMVVSTDFPIEGNYRIQGIVKIGEREFPSDSETITIGLRL